MEDLGKLVLRIAVAGLMLPHGISKLTGGIGDIQQTLNGAGLPEVLGYGVYVGEILAPLLMLVGYYTRPAAAVLAFNMVVAILLVHSNQLTDFNQHGGLQLEVQYLFLLGAVAIALLGAGKYSVSKGATKWD